MMFVITDKFLALLFSRVSEAQGLWGWWILNTWR